MKNAYEVQEDFVAVFINSPKYGRLETLIDLEDLPIVMEYRGTWCARRVPGIGGFYAVGNITTVQGRKSIDLHRYITNAQSGIVVDHINHNGLDNRRKINLRICTTAENLQNKRGAKAGSVSGVRNVSWENRRGQWLVQVMHKHIGYFDDIKEAETAAVDARNRIMTHHTA
ncbi:hypothetical protein [Paenibacillus sp. YIM B09110]|uniref:hypothetical protein n=1 Tax=Paenibacillus sp. YIM B09110 TaxID=3126102 RepID=UPI00301CE4FF